ncbi:MAG: HAD family hydrolase [Archangium sp.]|nr:HAD family hydrolase [Archangium sp.]
MFAAVIFDLDETLIPDEPVSRHAFFITALELTADDARAKELAAAAHREAVALWQTLPSLAADYVTRIGHSALEGLWATYDPGVAAEALLEKELARIRPEVWRRALASCGLSGDPERLQLRWQALRARFPLFDDCDELLARIRPRTKLAMITNGVSGLQRRKVNGSGLLHWFDVVAISGELGIGKPDARIFEWVCSQLNVPPSRCAMVGDNPERDIQGGINAGMQTAWVDRGLKPRGAKADVEVKSLGELLPWLRRG